MTPRGIDGPVGGTPAVPVVVPEPTPGAPVELAPRLWQVAGPGITHPWDAAAYLVTAERPVLVDAGTGRGDDALDEAVASCGVPIEAVTAVVATHGHYDHIGDGARLTGLGIPVLVHPADAVAVAAGDPVRTCAGPLYASVFRPFDARPLADGGRLELGGAELEIVHTPGHTPGSVCVVVRVAGLRVLLAGDTLWGGFSAAVGSDEDAWRGSLARLADLRLDALSFGHGITGLLGDTQSRLAEARAQFATYYNPWFRPPKLSFGY